MKLSLFSLTLSLSLTYTLVQSLALDPALEAVIDSTITNYFLKERQVPGFGLTIVRDGETVLSKGYGFRNFEKNQTTTNSSLFGLGSVTKVITSTIAIKVLMEKFPELGGSVIDTPIKRLAPDLNFTLNDRYREENINFRDLFAHRHCIGRGQSGISLLFGSIPTPEEFAYRQRYVGQNSPFRSGCFSYSNEIYGLAGTALAHIANTTFANMALKFMREIGMTDALVMSSNGDYQSDPNINTGYYWKDDESGNQPFNNSLWRKIHVADGGGGIFASPRDLGEFLKFHLNGGKVGDRQIMTQDQLNIVYDFSERIGTMGGKNSDTDKVSGNLGYGLGITISLLDGWKLYQHAGNFPPFRNKISFSPKQKIGIFTTGNSMNFYNEGDMDYVHLLIAELFKRNSTHPEFPAEFLQKLKNKEIPTLPSSDFDYTLQAPDPWVALEAPKATPYALNETEILGVYGSNVDGNLEILRVPNNATNSSSLFFSYGTQGLGHLVPKGEEENRYTISWTTDVLHQLWSDGGYRDFETFVQFGEDFVQLWLNGGHYATFYKDQLLNSAPVVPWAPGSCSP